MLKYFSFLFVGLFIFSAAKLHSQSFGFGCLGFVGGYGGFTYLQYDAKGLNEFIKQWNNQESVHSEMEEFKFATGYRVGLNFFRATFPNNIIVSAKGYYQSLDKTNKAALGGINTNGEYSLDIDMRNWAVGIDVGWEFTNVVSWKVLDGAIHFNNVKLTETVSTNSESLIGKYESDGSNIGYSVGTGIIVAIIKDYISIEGLAGYTQISIDDLINDQGTKFFNPTQQSSIDEKFIKSGGFTAVVQLNVGFPIL
ncbi:MAG: hypothetical protein HKP17_06395 [Ignavibacteriaceae bacterium]|nr:hypothetical protein [Ignavibacteria bacterium]MBT8390185.1 hypothetical protein [Ignavibacteria bacterium]NNJ52782.1 hypothetical protein [Ignavibacteriaceae bacterium]